MTHSSPHTPARKSIIALALSAILVLLLECFFWNLPYWSSMRASTDTASAVNTLGPGLERTGQDILRVTNPTEAYLLIDADGTSPYYRVNLLSQEAVQQIKHQEERDGTDDLCSTTHLRLANAEESSTTQSVSAFGSSSSYVKGPQKGRVKIWVEEPADSLVPITSIRANVRVPFSFDWARVAAMFLLALFLVLLWPGSWAWRTKLDTSSTAQRWLFVLALMPLAVYSLWQISMQIRYSIPLHFHNPGGYTYDFDQYGHVANALLHGQGALDLPVPDALASAQNPYDIGTRNALKEQGVTPLYWDYAFYQGKWYSYFGVLPAVLLFLPYQAITSLWVPGGLTLPAASGEMILMFLFALFACLLLIRCFKQLQHRVSLAMTFLGCLLFIVGSNAGYLWFRMNFYSIPFAASLWLVCMGLWFWLGAREVDNSKTGRLWRIGNAPALSLKHIAAGSLCIAATIGCRPTFLFTALLAFPLFWPQIKETWHAAVHGEKGRAVASVLCAMLVPALAIAVPVLLYNFMRFGSFTDFGNKYQLTVADMTTFRTPLRNMPYTIFYYLFLPLNIEDRFPFLAISGTPLPQWSFTEYCVGGLFAVMPLALLAFAMPFLRKRFATSGLWGTFNAMVGIALALVVVDSYLGGFGWRYICDFAWLLMIPALMVTALLVERWPWLRYLLLLVTVYVLAIAMLTMFVVGREDSLIVNQPAIYHGVQSWFSLLP